MKRTVVSIERSRLVRKVMGVIEWLKDGVLISKDLRNGGHQGILLCGEDKYMRLRGIIEWLWFFWLCETVRPSLSLSY